MSEQWLPSASDQEDMQGPTVYELQETIEHLRVELEEYRSIAEKIGAEKAVSELAQARGIITQQTQEIERLRREVQTLSNKKDQHGRN